MPLLYIDPGTGSMLFSLFIGLATAGFFLAKALVIKLKFFITGRRGASPADSRHNYVIYSEGKQYWNVFKPVLDAFERRGEELTFYTSSQDDPFFGETYSHITGEYIGEGNRAFARLNFLQADICLMTTPGLEVYQLKRSRRVRHYSHILHDTGDATCYRLFGIDCFDSLLLTGDYQKKDLRALEAIRGTPKKDLVTVGSTYLDVLKEKVRDLHRDREESAPFTVLVSPSWGSGSLLNAFGEKLLDPLVETGWQIIVRPHPQSKTSEADLLKRLETRYQGVPNLEWDYAPENLQALSRADVMLSDYSGIIFDFIFLFDKPVFYADSHFVIEMYDASDLGHLPWRFQVVKDFATELKEEDLPRIGEMIRGAAENPALEKARLAAKEKAWQYIGESGDRVAEYLISKRRELVETSDTPPA